MGNNLNADLKGKWVVLEKTYFKKGMKAEENLFFCENGFGTSIQTMGNAVFGHFQDGEECRIEGYDIRRFATEEEVKKLN